MGVCVVLCPHFACFVRFRPHYGVEFRVEVVDSATDEPVGATVLTTQSLLQEQRDFVVEQQGFPFVLRGPLKFEGTRPLVLELRTGVKTGFSSEFFASSSGQPDSQSRQGKLVALPLRNSLAYRYRYLISRVA